MDLSLLVSQSLANTPGAPPLKADDTVQRDDVLHCCLHNNANPKALNHSWVTVIQRCPCKPPEVLGAPRGDPRPVRIGLHVDGLGGELADVVQFPREPNEFRTPRGEQGSHPPEVAGCRQIGSLDRADRLDDVLGKVVVENTAGAGVLHAGARRGGPQATARRDAKTGARTATRVRRDVVCESVYV